MDIEGSEGVCLREVSESGAFSRIEQAVIECHHNLPDDDSILLDVLGLLRKNQFNYVLSSSARPLTFARTPQDIMISAFLSTGPARS